MAFPTRDELIFKPESFASGITEEQRTIAALHATKALRERLQLDEVVLEQIQKESLPVKWNRCHQLSRKFKSGLLDLGIELFGLANSDSMTAFMIPKGNTEEIREDLKEKYGNYLQKFMRDPLNSLLVSKSRQHSLIMN